MSGIFHRLTFAFILAAVSLSIVSLQASAQDSATLLPDAPGSSFANEDSREAAAVALPSMHEASPTQKYILPDQLVPALTVSDKVLLGLRDAFSPFAASGWLANAGYGQLTNGSPNYGTDRGAFGQRLGAAALRNSSEGLFTDSAMAPLLREDPRYYRLGSGHNFFVRLLYAGTRPIITRTDAGSATPNLALLSGTMGGSALTNLYYPS